MKRKEILFFFLVPFFGFLVIFLVFSVIDQTFIKKSAEKLSHEQLMAAAEILKVNIYHFLKEGLTPQSIIDFYSEDENIYYMALLDENKNILGWRSHYEGYLPFSVRDARRNEPWIIFSPAGRILNILTPLPLERGKSFFLYLGYSLAGLDKTVSSSNRIFFFVFAVLLVAGIAFFIGLFVMQRNFLQKTLEAEEANKEKERFKEISAFTSAIAHEIRNPLSGLYLLFELLQKKGPAELKTDITTGKREIQKIAQMIDQFSSYLKPLQLKREKVLLRQVVETAHKSLNREFEMYRIDFKYTETDRLFLSADQPLLSQCFYNLLRNAFEATEAGKVSVLAKRFKRKILIQVEDTGKGMTPEQLKRVFDPFFTTKDKGMGIGLYLVKKIIVAHGGKIWATSQAGKGTTFFILMPGG